jgi:hypothetical protein
VGAVHHIIHVGSGLSAFGGIADIKFSRNVAMAQKATFSRCAWIAAPHDSRELQLSPDQ